MKKTWYLVLAMLFMVGLSFSAFAATFKIGDADFRIAGTVRINAAYQVSDKGDVADGASDSETDFFIKNPGNTRLSVWSNYDNVTGFIEMGFRDASVGDTLQTRHAFLTYDMGGGHSLTVGQTYSALALHFAEQEMKGSLSLFGVGNLYSGRVPMIRYTKKGEAYTLMLELENTDTVERSGYTTDEITPALVGSLEYRTGGLSLTPSFLVQQYELSADTEGAGDENVLAYAVALDAVYKFANKFQIDGELWYGENVGIFAEVLDLAGTTDYFGKPEYTVDGDVTDIASYGGWVQLSVPIDPVVMHIGGGYQEAEVKDAGTADSMERYGTFINFSYYATSQFLIQPEIAYFNYGEDNNEANEYGSDTYYGVHFRYNF